MLSRSYILCVALVLLCGRGFGDLLSGNSVSIDYSVTQVGTTGDTFIYNYTVDNSSTLPVQSFDIFFDPTLYQESSLTNVTPDPLLNSETEILFGVGPASPPAFDYYAQTGGIAAGTSVGGFEVEFVWLGEGVPGVQPFEISNPVSFAVIQTGSTQLAPSGVAPEPSTGSCMIGVLFACGVWMARRRFVQRLRQG
jgi:hypothetical protein